MKGSIFLSSAPGPNIYREISSYFINIPILINLINLIIEEKNHKIEIMKLIYMELVL